MKKCSLFFCVLALLAGLLIVPVLAVTPGRVTVRFHDETTMAYQGETSVEVVNVSLNGTPMELDVPALAHSVDGVDSRTLVPVRPIAEALGATVLWVGENRQVILSTGGDTVVLTLGSAKAVVNGETKTLPGAVPAQVVKLKGAERTMVPLRFVSEELHAEVGWDNDTYTALVTAQIPDPDQPVLPPAPDPTVTPAPQESTRPHTGEKKPMAGFLLRVTPDDNADTITLYLNAEPRYEVTDLGDRVVIDLPGFAIGSGKDGSIRVENPAVTGLRYAQHADDIYPEESYTTRVVLDLAPGYSYGETIKVTGDPNLQAVVVTVSPSGRADQGEKEEPAPQETEPVWVQPENWDPTAFTVALDAGHGGSAAGATYEDHMEKDITLPITLRAAQLLQEKGYNVVLTRSTDVYMDLYDRCDIANQAGCDIFVSIHANASATNRSYQGTFTYHYPDSVEGEKLAKAVQAAVVKETGSVDRGLLTNDYVVLRETWMPACLLETGFMSAHDELMKLITSAYQEKLAQGVAKGVDRYLSALPAKKAEPVETPGTLESPGKPSPVPTVTAEPSVTPSESPSVTAKPSPAPSTTVEPPASPAS